MARKKIMDKIKKKFCEIICRIFNIVPCMCDHQCECKNQNEKNG